LPAVAKDPISNVKVEWIIDGAGLGSIDRLRFNAALIAFACSIEPAAGK
jgi:hypothetical protein